MVVFYATIISTYILNLLARIAYEKKYRYLAIFWISFTAVIIICVSGLRSGIGDTGAYMQGYESMATGQSKFKFEGEFLFGILQLLVLQISSDPQIFIFVIALITNLLNIICFNKYRSYLELEIYLYITSGYYIVSMNGIRQCLAAAILFICTKFIVDGYFKKYFVCVVIISFIHQSALIMIPLYFIIRQEAWSKRVIQMMILGFIGVLFYDQLSAILFKVIEDTKYNVYSEYVFGGSSFTRTLVNAVPVVLAFIKRKDIKEKWPEGDIFINISILNLIFVSFSMVNMIFNRFTFYFQPYNFILIPFIIKNCFKGKERRIIYLGLIVCYFIFFYYEQVIGMGMSYPTKLNLKELIFY